MALDVEAQVKLFERAGKTAALGDKLTVRSHWNRNGHNGLVVIEIPGADQITVSASLLIEAVKRCHGFPFDA